MHVADDPAAASGSVPLHAPVLRIITVSRAQVDGSIYDEMSRIRDSALRHNVPDGVATALLHQSGWFVQWKEGPRDTLRRLISRIADDRRHHDLCVVHSSYGPRQLAGPWSMAIVQCADTIDEMGARVEHLRRDFARGRQYAPAAVWRRLSTPMHHPVAVQRAGTETFQRVLVCAARGTASFALVEWLGRAYRAEVVHRRFAGASDLDVASDYVDFIDDQRVLRVIAMARRGLTVPLTRAFLPDYSHILLLLSGEHEADLQLVDRLIDGCKSLAAPPHLLGMARDPACHVPVLSRARAAGLTYLPIDGSADGRADSWMAVRPHLDRWREGSNSLWPEAPVGLE